MGSEADDRQRADDADQGIRIPHTDDSLKDGTRGPTLLEDFHLREKITSGYVERTASSRSTNHSSATRLPISFATRMRALRSPCASRP
jgi:catalase